MRKRKKQMNDHGISVWLVSKYFPSIWGEFTDSGLTFFKIKVNLSDGQLPVNSQKLKS